MPSDMTPEQKHLWDSLQQKIEELKIGTPNRSGGSAGSTGYFNRSTGRQSAVVYRLSVGLLDGTDVEYFIEARYEYPQWPSKGDEVTFKIDQWTSYHQEFWEMQLQRRDNAFVADGKHYRINPDKPNQPRSHSGHDGRRFRVSFFDGRVVETTNLWFQGVIPPQMRDRLPDTARLEELR